ncbi:MAG: hypothetical protein E7645_02210 [Ruminococcaceae bacterium]|nr:hypothetical protein [Oscillospiraceae bacterium]
MDRTLPSPQAVGKKGLFSYLKTWLTSTHHEYSYLMVAFTVPAVLLYLMYVARGIYPFGDGTILVLDLNSQYVSFYEYLWDCLHGEGSLLYCFSRNLGGEFMGMYDYYVASPFALLIGLFPKDWIQESLFLVFLLKTGLCGFNMGFYLHKHSTSRSKLTIITFSILYALSSYCVIQMNNSMWIDVVLWLPLLTYGIEQLIKYGKFRLYVFTLAIILFSNFYTGYMACIFTVAYCFYYYFAHNQNNENNPTGEPNHFVRSVLRMAGWSLLAVGMVAIIIISARYSLALGKDDFSNPSWDIKQKFDLFELFFKLLPSSYDTVRPEGLPILYCGVLTLMLSPAFFISKRISNREKIAAALFILFFVASFATSTLDLVWHGFQNPNWLNYRYSFMLSFFLIILAFRAFENLRFTGRKPLLAITAFIGLMILIIQELGEFLTESNEKLVVRPFATIWLSLGLLVAYFIIICLWGQARPSKKETISVVMAFIVCAEVFTSGLVELDAFDKDVSFSRHSRYETLTDTFRPITHLITENDNGFYRTEKTYHRARNDNYALNMNSLTSSSSLLNRETIDFLRNMGYASRSHWSKYLGGTPVNDSLVGIKYIITKDDLKHYYGDPLYTKEDYGYDEDAMLHGSYDVYLNPYVLSIVHGVNEAYADFDMTQYDNPFDCLNAMVTAMLGEDETVEIFVPAVQNGEPELLNATTSSIAEHKKYAVSNTDSTGVLTYSYTVPENTELYYYFPSDYPREVKLKFNNSSKDGFGGSETQRIVSLGIVTQADKANDAKLEVTIDNSSHNLYIKDSWKSCIYYIDWAVFEEAMGRLSETPMVFDSDWNDDHLTGTVKTTTERQLMYTSIAYDEGWKVTVDGNPVEIFKSSDALVTFYVEGAGEHSIELKYMPDEYVLGFTVSVLFIAIFLALLILYPLLRKLPVVKHLVGIQRPELPEMEPEKVEAGPGDIGYRESSLPPVREGVYVPSTQEIAAMKQAAAEEAERKAEEAVEKNTQASESSAKAPQKNPNPSKNQQNSKQKSKKKK